MRGFPVLWRAPTGVRIPVGRRMEIPRHGGYIGRRWYRRSPRCGSWRRRWRKPWCCGRQCTGGESGQRCWCCTRGTMMPISITFDVWSQFWRGQIGVLAGIRSSGAPRNNIFRPKLSCIGSRIFRCRGGVGLTARQATCTSRSVQRRGFTRLRLPGIGRGGRGRFARFTSRLASSGRSTRGNKWCCCGRRRCFGAGFWCFLRGSGRWRTGCLCPTVGPGIVCFDGSWFSCLLRS
jgi:hypothetical protein